MSARWVSLALRRSAVFSSWMNQDPFLVFRMAAVPKKEYLKVIKTNGNHVFGAVNMFLLRFSHDGGHT